MVVQSASAVTLTEWLPRIGERCTLNGKLDMVWAAVRDPAGQARKVCLLLCSLPWTPTSLACIYGK